MIGYFQRFIRPSARRRLFADVHTFDRSRPLIFTHIPKTSGIALTVALNKALVPKRVFHGVDHSQFGDFADFDSFSAAMQKTPDPYVSNEDISLKYEIGDGSSVRR